MYGGTDMRSVDEYWRVALFAALSGLAVCAPLAHGDDAGRTNGLIGYWPMNEGQGHVLKDVAGLVGDGEQVGAEWVPLGEGFCLKLGAPFNAGIDADWPKPGSQGYLFFARAAPVGGRGYVRMPQKNLCAMAELKKLESFSVSLWAKPEDNGMADPAQGPTAFLLFGPPFYISVNGNKWSAMLKSIYKDGQTGIVGTAVQGGKWTHVALTHDGAFARFYVDGAEAGVENGPYLLTNIRFPPSPKKGGDIWISRGLGERGRLPPAFAGLVDDFKIYGRALSPADVKAEFEAGLAAKRE
jgi:hypothetical protein